MQKFLGLLFSIFFLSIPFIILIVGLIKLAINEEEEKRKTRKNISEINKNLKKSRESGI